MEGDATSNRVRSHAGIMKMRMNSSELFVAKAEPANGVLEFQWPKRNRFFSFFIFRVHFAGVSMAAPANPEQSFRKTLPASSNADEDIGEVDTK
jgi:hypothetical protein